MGQSRTCSLVFARCVPRFLVYLHRVAPGIKSRHQMRGHLSSLSTLCKRFASVLRWCDVDSFLNVGRLYQEIAPMEKRIDMHIDLLRREEFREMECVSDVVKCIFLSMSISVMADPLFRRIHAQFDHISETYFAGFDFNLGGGSWGMRCRLIMIWICSLRLLGWSRRRLRL